jgi:hypothetical protein
MFETLCSLIPRDADYPARTRQLDILGRVLDGTIYDVLPYEFHDERSLGGEYIPLRQRRPSVRYNLCRVVVEDSVALVFSEGHFPQIDSPDATVRDALAAIAKEARLNEVMIDAAMRGAVGSVALLLRVLRGRVFFASLATLYLTPRWQADAPDTLESVTEKFKVAGATLRDQGFEIPDPNGQYWFMRRWDTEWEWWYEPWPVGAPEMPLVDAARSVRHGLGFVPMVWVKNLPGPSASGDMRDGASTFRAAIETQIEIDYQLSQAGRGLKYSSDPTLLIKEPATSDNQIIKGAANALVVSEKGDARLLEIGGTASAAVIDYVRTLRELALESIHGNRADAQRFSAPTSGRALEMMNQGLVWLADNLRISYGEGALVELARMVLRASQHYKLRVNGAALPALDAQAAISLKWPRWYPPSADDRLKDAEALVALTNANLMSRASAAKSLAATYDIEDVTGELATLEAQPRLASPQGTP